MNNDSIRWRSAAVLLALVLGACGGDSEEGAATNKAEWEARHGPVINAVSLDVDAANDALTKGDRAVILSSCNQLQEDLADAQDALPVPDPAVDGSLRAAIDSIGKATPTCLQGARIANDNHLVEQAQREMKDARTKLDEAQQAIAAWA
ncbi:MAG TPA: hypothetical protein VHF27_13080 [Acidimicrobiales bacterium]|nr:hypothetical protein [Acidimicrobiales bacterium]